MTARPDRTKPPGAASADPGRRVTGHVQEATRLDEEGRPRRAEPRPEGEPALLDLQRLAGNRAVSALLGPAVSVQRDDPAAATTPWYADLVDAVRGTAVLAGVSLLAAAGVSGVNEVTNVFFWLEHPRMLGREIASNQPGLAADWIRIRDRVVKPALAALREPSGKGPPPAPKGTSPGAGATPSLADEFGAHASGIRAAGTTSSHRRAADKLVDLARAQLDSYPDLVRRYRQQDQPSAAEKVRVLGLVAVAAARMEYLLGSIYHRGRGTWETSKSNSGPMVDDYTAKPMAWCTAFATTALRRARGGANVYVWSGYKVANKRERFDYGPEQGGAFVGTRRSRNATARDNPFVALRETLEDIRAGRITDQTAAEAVHDFYETRIHPQPGDLMILRRGGKKNPANPNSFKGYKSHTTMVESVSGTMLSTIEGNTRGVGKGAKSGRVAGRVLDLTDPGDVEEIVFISRPSLVSGLPKKAAKAVGTVSTESADLVTPPDLLDPLERMNELLEELARDEGWVNTSGLVGASVAELSKPDPPSATR